MLKGCRMLRSDTAPQYKKVERVIEGDIEKRSLPSNFRKWQAEHITCNRAVLSSALLFAAPQPSPF